MPQEPKIVDLTDLEQAKQLGPYHLSDSLDELLERYASRLNRVPARVYRSKGERATWYIAPVRDVVLQVIPC